MGLYTPRTYITDQIFHIPQKKNCKPEERQKLITVYIKIFHYLTYCLIGIGDIDKIGHLAQHFGLFISFPTMFSRLPGTVVQNWFKHRFVYQFPYNVFQTSRNCCLELIQLYAVPTVMQNTTYTGPPRTFKTSFTSIVQSQTITTYYNYTLDYHILGNLIKSNCYEYLLRIINRDRVNCLGDAGQQQICSRKI